MKICKNCNINKPLHDFSKDTRYCLGVLNVCKLCRSKYNKDYYAKFPEKLKAVNLKRYYKITLEQYEIMNLRQEGKCAICGIKPPKGLFVDHDHRNNKVRELLCNFCNVRLYHFETKSEYDKFMNYLEKHK